MAHRLLFACAASLTLASAPFVLADDTSSAPAPAVTEHLLKESFEEGKKAPTGWRQGGKIPGVEYLWSREQASHGKRSLGFTKGADRYFPIAQWLRIVPHAGEAKSLEVNLKAKAVRASKAIVDIQFFGAGDDMLKHEWLAYLGAKEEGDPPADHDWGRYSSVVAIPTGTQRIGIALQMYGPGEVWFDELTARYVPAASAGGSDATKESPGASGAGAKEKATSASDAVADGAISVPVKGEALGEYLFVPATEKPAGLLVVLPGGDGSADFHPFVKNIQQGALGGKFAVAQPLAKKWRHNQQIVWPTLRNRTPGMKYATEELVAAVIKDATAKQPVEREQIYLLGWSSGGPACYATMLQKESPAAGAVIAMSVYKPDSLPDVANAADRSFYIFHSPDDQVCPHRMAKQGFDALTAAGTQATLVDYPGGHGWHGDMLGQIATGVEWLEKSREAK